MILPYRGKWPNIHETAFVAPSVDLIGEVHIGAESSVWFQSVIRGDVHWIRIGNRTNIQDHCMLHVTRIKSPLVIGDEVTVGHRVTLHGCRIGNRVLIGMGAVILDDAEIGDDCMIGAGTLITKRTQIPPRSLVIGSPGRVIRSLTDEELAYLSKSAQNYVKDAIEYRSYVQGPVRLGVNNLDLDSLTLGPEFPRSLRDHLSMDLPGDLPGELTGELSGELTGEMSDDLPKEYQEEYPEEYSREYIDSLPEDLPGDLPRGLEGKLHSKKGDEANDEAKKIRGKSGKGGKLGETK